MADRDGIRNRWAPAWGLPLLLAAITVGQIASAPAASAQSPVCRQLLAQARDGGGAVSTRALKRDLARTIAQADRRGCFGGFFFGARGKGCGNLLSRIDRLERLIHQPAARPARTKNRLQRELARNGCFEKPPGETADAFASSGASSSGSYRTVCVRSCDGYFFPIGFSQSRGDFKRHRDICKGIYGDASADLYFYPSDGAPENMVSVAGEAYAKQSFAFSYRQEFRAACQIELQQGTAHVRDTFLAAAQRDAFKRFKSIPIPVPRPAEAEAVVAEVQGLAAPPKKVSRILSAFPVYMADSSAPRQAEAPSKIVEPQKSDALGSILDFIAPPARADDRR